MSEPLFCYCLQIEDREFLIQVAHDGIIYWDDYKMRHRLRGPADQYLEIKTALGDEGVRERLITEMNELTVAVRLSPKLLARFREAATSRYSTSRFTSKNTVPCITICSIACAPRATGRHGSISSSKASSRPRAATCSPPPTRRSFRCRHSPHPAYRSRRRQRPVLTLKHLRDTHGMTFSTASKAMHALIAAGIARALTGQGPDWKKEPFKFSPPGDKYLVFIEGSNHLSFGSGLGARSSGSTDVVKATTLAFWDAYLENDEKAKAALKSGDVVKPFATAKIESN